MCGPRWCLLGMNEAHGCLGGGVSWGLRRGTHPIRGGRGGVGGTREGPQGERAGSGSLSGGRDTRPVACGLLGSSRLRTQHQILCDLCQVTWAPASVSSPGKWGSVRVHLSVVKLESLAHAKYSGCHRHGIFTPRLTEGVRSGAGEAAEDPPGPYESLIFY